MATEFQTQPFAIPMANMNLPPSEALNQIMDNLNHLNAIVNQAVTTIHSRIRQESQLLTSISQRIDNAYKTTRLIASNPKKSTTIFSPSIYPSTITNSHKPLINKTSNRIHPIQPKRSKYNLSLKERNQKPENTETVSLLQSINKKTTKNKISANTNNKTLQNTEIPQWIASVSDCVIFDTNCNAYKPSKNTEMQRRRDKKWKKKSNTNNNNNNNYNYKMSDAPQSIHDKDNHLKTEHIIYGDRIKYKCVLDRANMPKIETDLNLFEFDGNIAVANDIQWIDNNDEKKDLFMIPSDVLNERYMNIQTQIKLDEKQEEKAQVMFVHNYPTPKEIIVNETKIDKVEMKEKENNSSQKQSIVAEVKAQNKSLQKEDVNIEEKKEIVVSNENKKDKGVVRFVFDVNALKDAKKKLNKKKNINENKKEVKIEKEENLQGNIFMAIKRLRKFHADTDDEEDDNGSFYDSD